MAKPLIIPAALLLDGLPGDARHGFDVAAEAGYAGVAISTNHRELSPEQLGESGRRHLQKILAGKGLGVEALRIAVPRAGLMDAGTIDRCVEAAGKAFMLARELGVGTVSMQIGSLVGGEKGGTVSESSLLGALRDLAQRADAAGLKLALGSDSTEKLAGLLKLVDFEGAKIDLSGARAIGAGEDPLVMAREYAGRFGQFTASDAVRAGSSMRVVELGQGQLPLEELMGLLREQGFGGPTVVDVREMGEAEGAARRGAAAIAEIFGKLRVRA